jgi:hypothetical protein
MVPVINADKLHGVVCLKRRRCCRLLFILNENVSRVLRVEFSQGE